jgi:MFS family permease
MYPSHPLGEESLEKMRSTFSFMQGNVLVLTVCRVLWTASLSMTWPFFSPYVRALGGSDVEIGLIYAIGGLGGLILFPVGGFIADHRGRVKLTAIATYALALTHIFFIIAQDWVALAIGMFVQELFIFYLPAMSAIMADSLPPRKRGIGFATVSAIPQSVGLFATIIGGYVISYVFGGGAEGVATAMRIFFAVALAVGLLVATIRLKFLKETLKKSDLSVPLHNIPLLLKASYQNLFESFKWMSPTLWSITIITILITLFTNVAGPFWAVFAIEVIGLTAYEWALLVFLDGAIRIALSIPLGHLVDLYGTRRTILLSMLLAPIPIMLFPFCQNFLQVLPTVVILAIVNVLIWPASATLIANAVPRERRGRLLSILGAGLSIGLGGGMFTAGFLLYIPRILGSIIGGYVYAANPRHPWFILAISLIFCFVLSLRFIHEAEKKEV